MKKYYLLFFLFSALIFCSCNNTGGKSENEKNNFPENENTGTEEQVSVAINGLSIDSIQTSDDDSKGLVYSLDCQKSLLNWYCVTHTGYVKFSSGYVLATEEKIVNGNFAVLMDSIVDLDIDYELMNEVLENTLKSKDFFWIEEFPHAHFDLLKVGQTSGDSCEVIGNLTIKDISRQIRFKSKIDINDPVIIAQSERFSINRTQWGLTIYSENFKQTDKSFLFTDMFEVQISLILNIER